MANKKKYKIIEPQLSTSKLIGVPDFTPIFDERYAVFSFRYIVKGYDINDCKDKNDQCGVARRISVLSKQTWNQLILNDRHHGGMEKINKLNVPKPPLFENKTPVAFREGNMKPMVGVREKHVFYVLWIDHNRTVYDHD